MKGKLRKLLSVVVATAMTLSCLSVPALADTGDVSGDGSTQQSTETDTTNTYTSSHTYEIYQILKGTVSGSTISNTSWGLNAKIPEDDSKTADEILSAAISDIESKASASTYNEKLAVINNYVKFDSTPYQTLTNPTVKNNTITVEGVDSGYYLIKDKDGTQDDADGYYTLYVTKATGRTLVFSPKGSAPTVTKSVNDTDGNGTNDSASVGDVLDFTIVGTVSSEITSFNTYYYKITDTLSKGLTLDESSIVVKLKATQNAQAVDITEKVWVAATDGTDDTTVLTVATPDLKQFSNRSDIPTLDGNATVTVTYKATVNDDAVAANSNSAVLQYSNNPNASGTPNTGDPVKPGEEPQPDPASPTNNTTTSTTNTYVATLKIIKEGNNSEGVLDGAVFRLSGSGVNKVFVTESVYTTIESADEGTTVYYRLEDNETGVPIYTTTPPTADTEYQYYTDDNNGIKADQKYKRELNVRVEKGSGQTDTTVTGAVNTDGTVTFFGLGAGTYKLEEIKAPDGYGTMSDAEFTIGFNAANAGNGTGFSITATNSDYITVGTTSVNNVITCTILDKRGQGLPSTGGIGTTIFYVAGTILVLGAAVALITRRRMKNEVK